MYASFDSERYAERNKVEKAFSVIKRKFGEGLKARKFWYQVKEIKIKLILHNLTKAVQATLVVVIVEAFQQSPLYDVLKISVHSLLFVQIHYGTLQPLF